MADTIRVPLNELPPERRRVGVVNLDRAVREVSQERAEETLTQYTEAAAAGGFLKKVWNSVVTQNLFREYYRERAVAQARAEILKERSLYGGEPTGKQAQLQAERALAEYLVAAGVKDLETQTESRALLGDSTAELAIKTELEDQVAAAAADLEITREVFDDNIRPLLLRAFEAYNQAASQTKRATLATPNTLLATNLWDVVADLRALKGHNVGVQTVRRELDICLGELRHGARTAAEESQTEKILNLLNKRVGLGSMLVNESTVGAAIALGVSTVSMAGRSVMGQAAFWAGGLIGSSAVGAKMAHYREGRRLDRERWLHDRQVAQGQHTPERESESVRQVRQAKIAELERQQAALKPWNILQKRSLAAEIAQLQMYEGDRRAAFNEVRVESRSVPEALTLLKALNQEPDSFFNNPDNQQRVRDLLIDLDARAHVSLTARRDFLRFSSDSTVAEQRTAFLKLRSQVHARLEAGLRSLSADDMRAWKADYGIAASQARGQLLNQLTEQDGQYKKYRELVQTLVAKRAAVAGLLIGSVVQTVAGLMSDKITSPLEAAWRYLTGGGGSSPSPEVQAELQNLAEEAKNMPVPPAEVCDPVFEAEPALPNVATEPVVRDMYYVNAKPTLLDPHTGRVVGGSDLNELQLRWGGERGLTTLANGERAYVLDISSMKDHESWNGGFRAPDGRVVYSLPSTDSTLSLEQISSPKIAISEAIKKGQAVMLLVPEGGDRSQAIILAVDSATGQALIPESSPVAEYFSVQNGQAQFQGFRLEAAIRTGQSDGVTHVGVLAAFKGHGTVPNLSQSLLPKPAEPAFDQFFPQSTLESVEASAAPAGVQSSPSDIPLTLPLTGRDGLGSAKPKTVRQVVVRPFPSSPPPPPLPAWRSEFHGQPPATPDNALNNLVLQPQLEVLEDAESFGISLYSGTERVSEAVLIDRMYRYIFGHSRRHHIAAEADADALKKVREALQAHRDPAAAKNVQRLLEVINKIEKEILEALVVEEAEVVTLQPLPQLEVRPKAERGAPAFVELVTRTPEADVADLYQAVFGHSPAGHSYNYEQDVATVGQLWSDIEALGQASNQVVERAHTRLVEYIGEQYEERRIAKVLADHPELQGLTNKSFKATPEWLQQAEQALTLLEDSDEAPQAVSAWRRQLEALQAQPPKAEKPAEKSQDQFAGQPELQFLNTVDIQAWPATPAGMDQLLAAFGLTRPKSGSLPTQNLRRRFDQFDQTVRRANLRFGDRRRLEKKLNALHAYISHGVEQELVLGDLESFGRLGARWLNLRVEARQAFLADAAIYERARGELIRPIVETLGLRGSAKDMKARLTDMLRLGQQYREAAGTIMSWTAEERWQITAGLDLAQAALNLPPLPEPQMANAPALEAPPEAEVVFEPASDEMIVSYLDKALEIDPGNASELWQAVGETLNLLFERFDDHAALVDSLVKASSNTKANKIKTSILSRLNGELDRLLPADSPDEQVTIVRRVFDDYFEAYATQLRNR